jgi:hypothetical protein
VKNKFRIFLFFFTATQIFSQSVTDSLNFNYTKYQLNLFNTSFEKRLNTYNLNSAITYSLNANKYFIGLDENYFSSLVNTGTKNIKDEQSVSLIGEYKLSPFLQIGVLTQNSIYSNDRKIAINEASLIHSSFYTKYSPIDQFKIIPFGGFSINRQVNEDDRGAIYGTNLNLDRYKLSDFLISSNLFFQNEDISPRRNTNRFASINIKNKFDFDLTNLISAEYSNSRKDFYFEADSLTSSTYNISKNIQSRIEDRYSIEERIFNSRFTSDLLFDLSGRVSVRNIDRNTKYKNLTNIDLNTFDSQIDEFRLDFSGKTEYSTEVFFGRLKIDYGERDEKYNAKKIEDANQTFYDQRLELEKKKNNISEYTTISAIANFTISSKDNLLFSLLHRKLIYNTPSNENFDDRDELLSIFRMSYIRSFNHLFSFFLNLEGSLNHLVYIFAERSSNNNFRRIIKLTSGGEYYGTNLYSKNTFEVSANYTSYDFEDINPNIRSFSFRQFSAKDSTSFNFFNNVYLDLAGYVKLSEQATFVWKNFSNNPERYLLEYYLTPIFNIKTNDIKMGVGLRTFSLQTFRYNKNGEKYLSNKYNSIGPITDFLIRLPNIDLSLYGYYEFITNEENIKRELATLAFSVNWRL